MKNHSKKLPKWTIVRRIVQFAVLLLFLTPFLAEIEGENFFFGTLSSSEILGIMLTDPFGALQIIFASKTVHIKLFICQVAPSISGSQKLSSMNIIMLKDCYIYFFIKS